MTIKSTPYLAKISLTICISALLILSSCISSEILVEESNGISPDTKASSLASNNENSTRINEQLLETNPIPNSTIAATGLNLTSQSTWTLSNSEQAIARAKMFLPEKALKTAEIETGWQISNFTNEPVWWVNFWGLNVERAELAWTPLMYTEYFGLGPYNHVAIWLFAIDGSLYYKRADVSFRANTPPTVAN